MELAKRIPALLQLTAIGLTSVAASYAFQHTQTTYQIDGLCFYRYLAYAITILLGYVAFSTYKKHLALAFSFTLSVIALSPIGHEAVELFPSAVPFLAILMGATTILIVPSSRGRGFFMFLVTLVAPAILVESRIGGSIQLLATTESIGYIELSVITVCIVGGYFYLRYAALANSRLHELLLSGGGENDVVDVGKQCNVLTALIIIGASAIAAALMIAASIVAEAFQAVVATLPLYILGLAFGAGIALATIFYIFQLSSRGRAV